MFLYKFIIRNKQHNTKTEKETGIIPEYEKQNFVAITCWASEGPFK